MPGSYTLGAVVRVTGAFFDASGAPADPTTVNLWTKSPQGAVTTYAYPTVIVKDSTGVYHADLPAATVGTWLYRWFSTGTGQAAVESSFTILPSAFS